MTPAKRGRPAGRTYGRVKTILLDKADEARLKFLADARRTSEAGAIRQLLVEETNRLCAHFPDVPEEEKKITRGPRRPTATELKRVGVTDLESHSSLWLQCDACGQKWSPDALPGGKLPRGYWKCPKGCNEPEG